jgi:tetratricopeptide (TPR) repeat protein
MEILQPESEQPASPDPLSVLRNELADVIQKAAQELAAKVRGELPCWTAALENFQQLSQCRYLTLPADFATLHEELIRASQQAQQMTEALEALGGDPLNKTPALGRGEDSPDPLPIPSCPGAADLPRAIGPPEIPGVESVFALAEHKRSCKEYDQALALYGQVLQRLPTHRAAYVRRGQLRLFCRRPEEAIEDFTAALHLDEKDAETYLCRGDAHAMRGWLEEAVKDYTRCLALDPTRTRARWNRAVGYRLLGRLSQALAGFTEVIQEQPEHAAGYYNRGLVHAALTHYDLAIADFFKTVQLNPAHPEVRTKLREIRALRNEQTAQPEPAVSNAPSPARVLPTAEESVLRLGCPSCGVKGAIRWDKLGRLHSCRRCSRSFRVDPQGGLREVLRTKDNKWVDKETHRGRSQRARVVQLILRGVLPALGLAAGILLVIWLSSGPAASSEVELPQELLPRAELFTRAWLKKDWPRMRLLVRPGEDRNLYRWTTRHPPPISPISPGLSDPDIPIEVTVLSTQAQGNTIKVRFPNLVGGSGKGPSELVQVWEKRGSTWFFVVPGR